MVERFDSTRHSEAVLAAKRVAFDASFAFIETHKIIGGVKLLINGQLVIFDLTFMLILVTISSFVTEKFSSIAYTFGSISIIFSISPQRGAGK